MRATDDPYAVLMVPRDAGAPEIRAAFLRLIARWHPDRSTAADAHARSAAIIAAYRTLSRPERRRAHDDRRRSAEGAPPGGERRRRARRVGAAARRRTRRALLLLWAGAAMAIISTAASPLIQPGDDLPEALHADLAGAAPA